MMPTERGNRVDGRWVLAMLTALVVACMAIMLVWRQLTPPVPDARERRREFALPGFEKAGETGAPASAPQPGVSQPPPHQAP